VRQLEVTSTGPSALLILHRPALSFGSDDFTFNPSTRQFDAASASVVSVGVKLISAAIKTTSMALTNLGKILFIIFLDFLFLRLLRAFNASAVFGH